jgi:hypothetical protein
MLLSDGVLVCSMRGKCQEKYLPAELKPDEADKAPNDKTVRNIGANLGSPD